jgi:hypothetical protein
VAVMAKPRTATSAPVSSTNPKFIHR